MSNFLQRLVTPAFVTFQAHCWFAYAVVFTPYAFQRPWATMAALVWAALFAIKEFYVDKHFELDQTFRVNLADFSGYATGITLGLFAGHFT